jgi:hypothetical protein
MVTKNRQTKIFLYLVFSSFLFSFIFDFYIVNLWPFSELFSFPYSSL